MGLFRWFRMIRAGAPYNEGTRILFIDPSRAVERLQLAVSIAPDWPEAQHNLGNAFFAVLDGEQALVALDAAVKLRPAFPEAHNSRGRALVGLQRYREAIEAFDRALLLRPHYANAAENRSLAEDWMAEIGPLVPTPDDIPWIRDLVASGGLTIEQAARVIGVFVRMEERVREALSERIAKLRADGDMESASRQQSSLEESDYYDIISDLDGSQRENLVELVKAGGDQVI